MRYLWLLVSFAIVLPQVSSQEHSPRAVELEKGVTELEKTIREQQQRLQKLQERLCESEKEQPSPGHTEQVVARYISRPETQESSLAAGYTGKGFFVRSGDGNFELYLSGWLQFGLAVFENDTFENNSFYPNGISLATDVYLYQKWHGRIELNFAAPGSNRVSKDVDQDGSDDLFANSRFAGGTSFNALALWDAYVEYMPIPEFNVRLGQTHVPFTIEGQYNFNQGLSIWGEPFIGSWSHGRDPGIMIHGLCGDTVEYKLSLHNGEGQNRLNLGDDFLMAAGTRVYPFTKKENADTFFHVGFIRSRTARNDANNAPFDNTGTTGDERNSVVAAASLRTPWGRQTYGSPGLAGDFGFPSDVDETRGWRTGVDTGFKLDMFLDPEKINRIRMESEFMYVTWERHLISGRIPYLQGYGFLWGIWFVHNLTPEVEGAGIRPFFKFSYSQIDNKHTDTFFDDDPIANTPGLRMWVYTFGLAYHFNKFVTAQFNWVIVDTDFKDLYFQSTRDHGDASSFGFFTGSDDIEHGWFFQVTAQW